MLRAGQEGARRPMSKVGRCYAATRRESRGPQRHAQHTHAGPAADDAGRLAAAAARATRRDVLALALVALGVFLGFVLYGGWHGGRGRPWTRHGKRLAGVGRARILAPPALVIAGLSMLLGPLVETPRAATNRGGLPARRGPLALAGRHCSGSARRAGSQQLRGAHAPFQPTAASLGQALYEVAERLVGSLGVDLLVVFLRLPARC